MIALASGFDLYGSLVILALAIFFLVVSVRAERRESRKNYLAALERITRR